MSKVKVIPDPYTTADRTLLDKIEAERPYIDELHCHPAMWWRVGNFICTQFDNGYYHCYLLKKEYPYGKILRDYYINHKGEMVEGKRYYSVPTKEDFLSWCAERGIDGKSMIVV